MSLYDQNGQRKYLNETELQQFCDAVRFTNNPVDRAFYLTLLQTGCRISEALELTVDRVDFAERCVALKSLKKRGKLLYRPLAIDEMALADIRSIIFEEKLKENDLVWGFSRTTGWRRVKKVMNEISVTGPRATPRGLRHGFAISCINKGIQVTDLQDLLGHEDIKTTKIYATRVGKELRDLVRKTWPT